MLYGGHIKAPEDIDFLRKLKFDFGEVIVRDKASRSLWANSGVTNQYDDGFFLVAHGPHEGPPNDLNNIWNTYIPALAETVDIIERMGISFLTIHSWMDPRFVKTSVLEEKKNALRRIVDYGRQHKVVISLENLSENAADFEAVLNVVPDLAVTLDVGHGQLLTETNTSFGIIERLGSSIRHVHLHDNRGGTGVRDDLHLGIGEGIVDFPGILRALVGSGYNGTMTLELEKYDLQKGRAKINRIIQLSQE
ncbi:MAG: sugar phosphate isomerase/epimerase [Desulfomonile tiedjei]|uniref:Sugar phosphate isomerase/epimerase n=1 Tax=Desulfomonile tiedjei TaxID=2358 RepID=A0A9D6YZB1_9BACT|nr:sugar phosphate isomerase/epimerase [Desulfomonile tiedjei]